MFYILLIVIVDLWNVNKIKYHIIYQVVYEHFLLLEKWSHFLLLLMLFTSYISLLDSFTQPNMSVKMQAYKFLSNNT